MAPRWFKNVQFGQDLTNAPFQEIIDDFKKDFMNNIKGVTFNSTGPIIEEVLTDDEGAPSFRELSLPPPPSIFSSPLPAPSPPSPFSSPLPSSSSSPAPSVASLVAPSPATLTPANFGPVRRSCRQKHKPLDYARGQRILYDINKQIKGIDDGFPSKYNYSRKSKKPASSIPRGASRTDSIKWKDSQKGNFKFHVNVNNNLITGLILLDPSKCKPQSKTSVNQIYSFLVRSGKVLINATDLKKPIFADTKSDWISISPGERYTIRNCGQTTATIAYIVSDRNP